MDKKVPLRKLEIYQTDDGRRIETFVLVDNLNEKFPKGRTSVEKEYSNDPVLYVGLVHIMTEYGPQELRFEITGVDSIGLAFEKYYDFAGPAVEELKRQIAEQQREAESRIITANGETLNVLDQEAEKSGKLII